MAHWKPLWSAHVVHASGVAGVHPAGNPLGSDGAVGAGAVVDVVGGTVVVAGSVVVVLVFDRSAGRLIGESVPPACAEDERAEHGEEQEATHRLKGRAWSPQLRFAALGSSHDLRNVRATGLEDGAGRHPRPRGEVGGDRRGRGAGRRAGLRLDLGLRPLPQRPRARPRDDVRVLDDPGGAEPADLAGAARSDGQLRAVPEPRDDRQDHLQHRRHLGWTARLGDRRRLVRRRVQGLRLRLPVERRPDPDAARDGRDREADVVGGRRPLRGTALHDRRRTVRPEAPPGSASPHLDRWRR